MKRHFGINLFEPFYFIKYIFNVFTVGIVIRKFKLTVLFDRIKKNYRIFVLSSYLYCLLILSNRTVSLVFFKSISHSVHFWSISLWQSIDLICILLLTSSVDDLCTVRFQIDFRVNFILIWYVIMVIYKRLFSLVKKLLKILLLAAKWNKMQL